MVFDSVKFFSQISFSARWPTVTQPAYETVNYLFLINGPYSCSAFIPYHRIYYKRKTRLKPIKSIICSFTGKDGSILKFSAVLLAAGKGTRYHGTKQDVLFHDKPLWRYAYETAATIVGTDNIVAVGKDIEGGITRTGSVMNGLKALPKDTDRVIIIEAARPMVTQKQILDLLQDPKYV